MKCQNETEEKQSLQTVQLLWVHLLPLKWVLDTGTKWAVLAWFLKVQRPSQHRRDHSWTWLVPQHIMGCMRRQPMLSVCTLYLSALSMSVRRSLDLLIYSGKKTWLTWALVFLEQQTTTEPSHRMTLKSHWSAIFLCFQPWFIPFFLPQG